MDAASRAGVGFYESPMKLTDPKPKPSFIESYMASARQDAEGRGKERQQLSRWLENVIVVVAVAGIVLSGLALIAIQIALLLLALLGVVVAALAIPSMFSSKGSE